jgi:CopG family nickel-responsive transcriptional regulator
VKDMTKIVSFSMSDEIVSNLDTIQKEMGFSGRSDAVRNAISILGEVYRARKQMRGYTRAILVVVHAEHSGEHIGDLRHKYASYIKLQLHDHLDNHQCMELFFLQGDGRELAKIVTAFDTTKGVRKTSLVVL